MCSAISDTKHTDFKEAKTNEFAKIIIKIQRSGNGRRI